MTSTSVDQSKPWAVSIEAELKAHAGDRGNAGRPSVCRVPSLIKALKPQMYQHQVLSLGLYDRDFVNMAHMDKLQLRVVSEFLEQIKETVSSWDALCECVAGPVEKAEELRQFYHVGPGESPVNPITARSVLTFDAVFLSVFVFLLPVRNQEIRLNPQRFSDILVQEGLTRIHQIQIHEDILLFENQIPLRLVWQVWNQFLSVDNSDHGFNTHIRRILSRGLLSNLPSLESFMSDNHISFVKCSHLLHCLYMAVCNDKTPGPASDSAAQSQSPLHPERTTTSFIHGTVASGITRMCAAVAHWTRIERWVGRRRTHTNGSRRERSLPTATELHKAGVKFRGSGEDTSVSEIRLEKSTFRATLYLQQIDIYDSTEMVLRNLSAFETMSSNDYKIVSYLLVMDNLINTADDVRLLMKGNNPVIGVNHLGSDNDIAELFNAMNQNVIAFDNSGRYERITKEVNDWCAQKTRQNVIRFLDRFVDRPWILISSIAATLLLVMTALQTVYTVKGFYQQT